MNVLLKGCLLATGSGILAVPLAAHAAEGDAAVSPSDFRLSAGVSVSSGDYGEAEDTDVFALPVSLTFRRDGLKVRVSVPWVRVDGPGSLISTPEGRDGGSGQGQGRGRGGDSDNSGSGSSNSGPGSASSGSGLGGGIEVENENEDEVIDDGDGGTGNEGDEIEGNEVAAAADNTLAADNSRSGIGDVNVTATYSFDLGGDLYFEPGVKLKLPTASRRKRLGTGKFDVMLTADLVKDIGNASLYVHGRRKFAGKPAGSTIRSTWGAGGGASMRVAPGFAVGADYDWQQSAFAGRQASSEATAWAYARLARQVGLTLYASTGFNANSADFAGGASISYRF